MSNRKLKKMSVEEILEEIGTEIDLVQLEFITYEPNYQNEDIFKWTKSDIINYIKNNSDEIDKEKLAFSLIKNLSEEIAGVEITGTKNLTPQQKVLLFSKINQFEKSKELLKDVDIEMPIIVSKDDVLEIHDFVSTRQIVGEYKSNEELEIEEKNARMIENIKQNDLLENIANISCGEDFIDYLAYKKENGKAFRILLMCNWRKFTDDYIASKEEKLSQDEIDKIETEEYIEVFSDILENYSGKIDIEKLLLVSSYRAKKMLEFDTDELSIKQKDGLVKIMEYANQNIENRRLKIKEYLKMRRGKSKEKVEYTVKELQQDLTRIVEYDTGEKFYFSKQQLTQLKKLMLEESQNFLDINEIKFFNLLELRSSDKQRLIANNPKCFDKLISFGALNKSEIEEAINNLGGYKIIDTNIDYLCKEGLIDEKDLINMYMHGNVDLGKMIECDKTDKFGIDLQSELNVQKLMKYYFEVEKNESKTTDFDRYALLFRELKVKGKSIEEQNQIAEEIGENILEMTNDEYHVFEKFYKADILSMQSLVDWNDEEIIYKLIENQEIKPCDIKQLLITDKLDLQKTYNVLANSDLSDVQKMNFIFSSFDGNGKNEQEIKLQNNARMYLIQAINMSKDFVNIKKTDIHRQKGVGTTKGNKYVTDPVYRWQLFSQIDDECTTEAYGDGTVKFTLPNVNNGTVVIEKLFKRTKEENEINYGSATYVMSQDEFLKNKADIEQDGRINRRTLIEMQKEGITDKMVHSAGWGKSLKGNLELCVENGYSEEKITKIDELISTIENARELVK